jgi:hypothetical protein
VFLCFYLSASPPFPLFFLPPPFLKSSFSSTNSDPCLPARPPFCDLYPVSKLCPAFIPLPLHTLTPFCLSVCHTQNYQPRALLRTCK